MGNFQIEKDKEIVVIKCPTEIATANVEEFADLSKSLLLEQAKVFILDFGSTLGISPQAFQPFLVFKKELKGIQKMLFSIGLKEDLLNDIKNRGLEAIFSPEKNIDTVKKAAGLRTAKKLDVSFINPFIVATKTALEVQADTEVSVLKPYVKKEALPYDIGIAGVISLITDGFTGSITLCFPTQTFLDIYNKMFEEDNKEINEELEDFAGELLNIIYGQAKVILNDELGHELQKALPAVLTSEKLKIRHTGQGPVFVLPFDSQLGKFHIEIEMASNGQQQAA
ncbi:MAG: chemotaxis protein CheX [Bdellovibrionales bacterium]|nr:chemotaxis protein CheX [Bdellovibrionales bacterium]